VGVPILAVAQQPAAQPEPGQPITLRFAIEQSLARNPELQGFDYRLRAQEGRITIAGLDPPFELRGELENLGGSGNTTGFDGAEATFSLSRVIELGGKRQHRLDAARATLDVVDIERQAAQLDVVAEVTRRFIHVAADQERLALTRRATELAQETLDAARRRVEAARAPDAELHRANATLARARIEEEHAEHELLASRRKLTAMWGVTRDSGLGAAAGNLYSLPQVPEFDHLVASIDASPDFLRFASEARLRDAEIRVAQSRARADVTLNAGVRRLEATDEQAFVLGASIPLFARSRAQGAISEARALRSLTDAELAARRVRVEAQLFEIYQELRHAVTEEEVLRNTVLPAMDAALRNTELAFERGRYGYLEWVDAQRELIDVQRARIDAATNAHLALTEIERLTGAPLPGTP